MVRRIAPLIGMTAMLLICAWSIAGLTGAVIAFFAVMIIAATGPRLSSHATMRFYGARPFPPARIPGVYAELSHLAEDAGLPVVPRLYRLRTSAPMAFAVGDRADPAIAVSDGLLYLLGGRERAGVLAHEVAHIAAGDVTLMRLGDLLRRMTAFLCHCGLLSLLLNALLIPGAGAPLWIVVLLAAAPVSLGLLQLSMSRGREFAADAAAARLTGDPAALAGALTKLERINRWNLQRLFGQLSGLEVPSCLRTHPATEERIERLGHIRIDMDEQAAKRHRRPAHYLMRFDPSGNPF